MTLWTLIRRSLRFHARSHLGVVLGAAVGSAALIGALIVGDSVRESLREQALQRLGWIYAAMAPGERFFTQQLAEKLNPLDPFQQPSAHVDALLNLPGTAARHDGTARANFVSILGVPDPFLRDRFGATDNGVWAPFTNLAKGTVVLNEPLALQLRARPGDDVLLRIHKPGALSRDMPITPQSDASIALRLKVHAIVRREQMGNFSLQASQSPPLNAFLNRDELAEVAGLNGKANMVVAGERRSHSKAASAGRFVPSKWDETWFAIKRWWRWGGGEPVEKPSYMDSDEVARLANKIITQDGGLTDYGLRFRENSHQRTLELVTDRIFLEGPVLAAVSAQKTNWWPANWISLFNVADVKKEFERGEMFRSFAGTNTRPILTYLVNQLRSGGRMAPYSMVTAAGSPWTPPDMRDDEIIINQWLADDLQLKPGDPVDLAYFLAESGAQLVECTNRFRVRAVVSLSGIYEDRTLMPEFPGVSKAESTHDWDAGFPLVHKIRDQDEKYWKEHRGTPKAFVTLAAGQSMWGNRFGNLTAIRYPLPAGEDAAAFRTNVERSLLLNIDPAALGLRFEPVRAQALKAASGSQDFGGLFIGFSFFLIGAALILMGLLFQFGIEQRAAEIGTLLALGWEPRRVRRLFLIEGMALALVGGALGAVGGIYYARALLHGLTTVWRDAVGASALTYHATAQTLLIGFASAVIVSALTIWLVLRKLGRRPARELLTGNLECGDLSPPSRPTTGRRTGSATSRGGKRLRPVAALQGWFRAPVIACVAGAGAVATVVTALATGETSNPEYFFTAGALCLIATLGAAAWWLGRLQGWGSGAGVPPVSPGVSPVKSQSETRGETPQDTGGTPAPLTLRSLGLRGTARRRTRSLATIALLACGSFLIASIGINRLDANLHAEKRSSGTGGFALIGESTLPMVKDLNTREGREALGLDDKILQGVSFVPFRVRNGDDASCLNLNRAQTPRLLGVKPGMMEGRFTLARGEGWRSLINTGLQPGDRASANSGNRSSGLSTPSQAGTGLKPGVNENEISAIADAASIQWALHKKIGDTLVFTGERGDKFKTRLIGGLANSILQGSLIIGEDEFLKRFPGESGYRMFLIDCPSNALPKVSAELSRALQDYGFEVTPAARRLAQFNAVQNTYLNTFQLLGGLGLLLGSAGLGVVVLRNVLERRGELALLLAVGFERGALQRLVLAEHAALLVLGLGAGLVSAVVSVLPTVLSPTAEFPLGSLVVLLAGVFAVGLVATWLATRWALRGDLLAGLRNE